MRQTVRLGSSKVTVSYPEALHLWFDGLVEPLEQTAAESKWVGLSAHEATGSFAVFTSTDPPASGLNLGDALATFWERVSFLLLDDLRDAIALHTAVLHQDNRALLLPGQTGSGKTRLSLWYRKQGFELVTDEIAITLPSPSRTPAFALGGALARPVILKDLVDANELLQPGEEPIAYQDSYCGWLIKLKNSSCMKWTERAIHHGLIVFPQFTAGVPFKATALTPGEACLGIMENCLNVRNLPRGGLPLASTLARYLPAISVKYGETSQLEGTLDVLTRQLLGAPSTASDRMALCAAFTVKGTAVPAAATVVCKLSSVEQSNHTRPAATTERFPRRLTVGMATYDDYDGVYFTIQSIRFHNPDLEGQLEFVVIDNNPAGRCSEALSNLGKSIDGYRYVPSGEWSGTAIRNLVFEEASSPFVLCVDSHVLIAPSALSKLISYFEADPNTRDLLQGPLLYDDLRKVVTHMEPRWRGGMFGTWSDDPRGEDLSEQCFEIPMHGLGLFACRRTAWPGFNPEFRGFGGEEGYIHEKMRRRGGRTLCLPFLRWVHRFDRPLGPPYVNRWEDRIRNYYLGFTELGLDTGEMESHFAELLGRETSNRIFADIKIELAVGVANQARAAANNVASAH
jgi:hypothetical protein